MSDRMDCFAQVADTRLAALCMTEDIKRQVRLRMKENRGSRRGAGRMSLRLVLALALLLMTATAFALTDGFGIFKMMGQVNPDYAKVQESAEGMVQKDLAFYSFPHVDVAVGEAVYDGKYLRVAYSVHERDALEHFTQEQIDTWPFNFEAAERDGVWWDTLDYCDINGEHFYPLGSTGTVPGPRPGEIISWVQFDLTEARLPDPFRVRLPFRFKDSPKELDFTMDKGGLKDVYKLKLPADQRAGNHLIRVTEALFTPIRVYLSIDLIFDAGVTMEEVADTTWTWMGEAKLTDAEGKNPLTKADWAAGFTGNHAWAQNDQGEWEDQIVDPTKPVTSIVINEFVPLETYPDALRFGVKDDSILIPHVKAE